MDLSTKRKQSQLHTTNTSVHNIRQKLLFKCKSQNWETSEGGLAYQVGWEWTGMRRLSPLWLNAIKYISERHQFCFQFSTENTELTLKLETTAKVAKIVFDHWVDLVCDILSERLDNTICTKNHHKLSVTNLVSLHLDHQLQQFVASKVLIGKRIHYRF